MRVLFLLLFPVCLASTALAQNDPFQAALSRGTTMCDNGDYVGAIKVYDSLIAKSPTRANAWYEKSYTLFVMGKYQDCIDLSKQLLIKFPDMEDASKVYGNYGSSLDELGKPDDALAIYASGIKQFPGDYNLYLNKALTEYNHEAKDAAVEDLKHAIWLNPTHASSHMYMSYAIESRNKMAAIMSLSVYLLIEPTGERAEKNLKILQRLIGGNVTKKDDKNITISLSEMVVGTKEPEDDFHAAELMLSMRTAMQMDDKYKDTTAAQKLAEDMDAFGLSLDGKAGFFMNFYSPFFREMKAKGFTRTAAYVMYASNPEAADKAWLQSHKAALEAFYKWFSAYQWPKE